MATELAKAYVQIVPSAKGIQGSITKELGGEASSAGHSFGGKMVGAITKVIAAAGIGKVISSALTEGADLQQSLGGIETLFKESADKVKQNAANAYKTAGLSANEYMELTTSFSASLLSSLGNNTSKAADIADMAMIDMSDNANKMGSSMEDIKNAYQGFAKQNYTMLDNLKLGYGGTKTEMERLLKDAQKISGVKYDINNLSDVYSAIHVIQGELDITGTTAKEASETFSGSMAAMKAAFKNVLGNLTLGQDISGPLIALQETVHTFLVGNLIPMVGNILNSLPQVLSTAIGAMSRSLNIISDNADQIIAQGADFVSNLVTGIVTNLPYLAEAAWNMVNSLGNALMDADWGSIGQNLISNLQSGLDIAAGEILGTDGNIISSVVSAIETNLPNVLNKGIEIVTNVVNGILSNLPSLITMAGTLMSKFASKIIELMPQILSAGSKLISNLVKGIINNLPQITTSAAQTIAKFLGTVGENLPKFLQSGIEIIGKLAAGLIRAIPDIVGKIPQIITSIRNAFLNVDWWSIGKNIIRGIASGLRNAGSQLWEAVKGVLGNFKDQVLSFFGIHSPSTWGIYVGEMIDKGFANGVFGNLNIVKRAADELLNTTTNPFNTELVVKSANNTMTTGDNTHVLNRLDDILKILEAILKNKQIIQLILNDRELARALRELGVVFA